MRQEIRLSKWVASVTAALPLRAESNSMRGRHVLVGSALRTCSRPCLLADPAPCMLSTNNILALEDLAVRLYRGSRVLVTGADGFIGSHLVERLISKGAEVTALALYNSFDSYGWLDDLPDDIRAQLTLVRGDVRDANFVRRLLEGQQIVFHLAALIAIPHSYVAAESYVDTNVRGTLYVLEAARACGTERVVHTSTSEVYGTAITVPISEEHPLQGQSPYSASKIGADMMAEAYARSFGLPVCILRPFNTFGPRQSERAVIPTVIRQLLDPSCPTLRVGDPTTSRDFTFVADTAEAFLAMGAASNIAFGRSYNAGNGEGVTISTLIDMLARITGISKPVESEDMRMRPPDSEVRTLLADSNRITEEIGWQPQVRLEDGLTTTVAWWRKRLAHGKVRRSIEFIS
jgi:NAD dependent epimerase/dehydratase